MKPYKIIVLLIIVFSSCKTQQAIISSSAALHSEAYDVYPSWTVEYSKSNKYIPMGIGLGAAAYGYLREPISIKEKPIGKPLTSLAFGILGYWISAKVNKSLQGNSSKMIPYKRSQSKDWLEQYNQRKGTNYTIINDPYSYPLRILPHNKEKDYRIAEAQILRRKEQKEKREALERAKIKEEREISMSGDPDKWDKYIHTEEELIGQWNMARGLKSFILKPNNKAIYIDKTGYKIPTVWSLKSEYDNEASELRQYLYIDCCVSNNNYDKFWIKPSPKYSLRLKDEENWYQPFFKEVKNRHDGITKSQYNDVLQYFTGQWKTKVSLGFLSTTQVVEFKEDGTFYSDSFIAGSGSGSWYIYYDNHDSKKCFYLTLKSPQGDGLYFTQRYAIDAESLLINSFDLWGVDTYIDEKSKYERIDNIEEYTSNIRETKIGGAKLMVDIITGFIDLQATEKSLRKSDYDRKVEIWKQQKQYEMNHKRN